MKTLSFVAVSAWCGRITAFLVTFLLLAGGPGWACNICLPYPSNTALDYALESETLVLAREDPKRPYSFKPIEVVKGLYDGSVIPLLVDSTTKRMLDSHPNHKVVLARNKTIWRNLGYASEVYEDVIRELVFRRRFEVEKYSLERALFFVPYLGHSDRQLSELAHLEVARAPYSVIRVLNSPVSREKIYSVLRNIAYMEWQALYILMLGSSDRPDDVAFVLRRLQTAAKFDMVLNLSAYLTAYIEMAGQKGIDFAKNEFLAKRHRDKTVVIETLKALSIQGREGRIELRSQIIEAYGDLLVNQPELAGYVAKDLTDWQQTQFSSAMARLLMIIELDEPSELAVRAYLRFSGTVEALPAIQAIGVRRERAVDPVQISK